MSYDAKVFNVMIASPGDVSGEKSYVKELVHEWNTINSPHKKIVLRPVSWDTDTYPKMGAPPQHIVNKQILDECDLLVGIFWTRIGTPTSEYPSGTVEEIERHIAAKKPTMLYFSNTPAVEGSADPIQVKKLNEFKESCKKRGLCETYDSLTNFREKFYRELQLNINKDEYFNVNKEEHKNITENNIILGDDEKTELPISLKFSNYLSNTLSREAQLLLKEASNDEQGTILYVKTFGGTTIQTNNKNMITDQNPREVAKWEKALADLKNNDLIKDRGFKGEVFAVTDFGYRVADTITL